MIESPYASISGPEGIVNEAWAADAEPDADGPAPAVATGRDADEPGAVVAGEWLAMASAAASLAASIRAVSLWSGAVRTMTAVTTARAATPAPTTCLVRRVRPDTRSRSRVATPRKPRVRNGVSTKRNVRSASANVTSTHQSRVSRCELVPGADGLSSATSRMTGQCQR